MDDMTYKAELKEQHMDFFLETALATEVKGIPY
jgi:hypothetical protein